MNRKSAITQPLHLPRGPVWSHRIALAPMTNMQSHANGALSDDEINWLTMRADGGFSMVMTAAAHVEPQGQGFAGQLGIFDDALHLEGLTRLADAIRSRGAVSSVQLHHGGLRSPADLVGVPVGPSAAEDVASRALTLHEVEAVRDNFIAAAVRAERAGFDGVEIHGAHGYLLSAFLSRELNRRTDRYGGSPENRARLLLEVIDGIRSACRPDFQLGVRLSPERFGQDLGEIRDLAAQILLQETVDYLDMSLWNVFKKPEDDRFGDKDLLDIFGSLPRDKVALGVAGKISNRGDAEAAMAKGADFVLVGRAAILNHDFARRVMEEPGFTSPDLPVTSEYLQSQGVGPAFLEYLGTRDDFLQE
ncbi:NADH:flavin oxidoreductase [Aurantiacibacter rhizosphaerae]|uniref:NADH:flavin oxidoreductase n=1 Tax=Aurantiacibacter rhizosphaerae TaxID=2691582 RepID=A0A844XC55_9SPHN|nr:NADH:flavin oxidoreductase [Aurantiacibacter rhizosphaerae]MWV27566.1 NADH:flavin oxidoreductase [Aurantiacibacter rhizosphaerae]